ncbi:hypothetical protein [Mycolicibacterium sp. D5.8-2]|uniref:hypothetical protein n=1 Tax=Mycolicibacterium sp. D5.8-2 TaxID=3085903 RepID=UPI00298D3FC8|nr:hypothetical protein [Mycolicibacterium sp. D5.8-2]MDW5612505.1 hypothetical protein [Mycolicibacterium sp. D5.8-2]
MSEDDPPAAAATGRAEPAVDTEVLSVVRRVASRFVEVYTLVEDDPDFAELFAETVEVWHNFDHETMVLPGREFAAAMLRMLRATAEIVRSHSDHAWSLKVDTDGFAMAATASGELESGVAVRISRCLLITVHDGRIIRICEFGDRQQRAPLDDALRAAGRFRS